MQGRLPPIRNQALGCVAKATGHGTAAVACLFSVMPEAA